MPPNSPFSVDSELTNHLISAIHALARGEADPDQQVVALKFIIEGLAAVYHPSYRATDRETCIMEGRRFVGLQLIQIINVIKPMRTKNGRRSTEQPD